MKIPPIGNTDNPTGNYVNTRGKKEKVAGRTTRTKEMQGSNNTGIGGGRHSKEIKGRIPKAART